MKPITFSTPMVQAILDGRKTQTRRIIKDKDITNNFDIDVDGSAYAYINPATGDSCPPTAIAKYQVGDILWVRETWYKNYPHKYGRYWYRADGEEIDMPTIYGGTVIYGKADGLKWRPSIFMPREAARIFLRVTNVRAERVQEITENDAKNEGVKDPYEYQSPEYYEQPNLRGFEINKSAFAGCWDSIYSKRGYGWDTNPWVWVYEFERIRMKKHKVIPHTQINTRRLIQEDKDE